MMSSAMVEPPDSWDRVTAWLAVTRLGDPHEVKAAWDYMVAVGWLVAAICDLPQFEQYVEAERAKEITGPSAARRIMLRLDKLGALTSVALETDPWGRDAERRKARQELEGSA